MDSLQNRIEKLSGIEKVDALNQLAFEMFSYDFSKSKQIAQDALLLSNKLNYDKGIAEALIYVAVAEFSAGHDSVSIPQFKRSITLCENANLRHLKGFGLTYLGLNYQNLNKLDSSKVYLEQAYTLLKDSVQPYYLSFLYLNLASLSELRNEPSYQIDYLQRSWSIRSKMADKKLAVYAGERIASFYNNQGDYLTALSYLDKIQRSLGSDTLDNEEISIIYKQRALVFLKQGKPKEALNLFYKTRSFYERNQATLDLANSYLDVGVALMRIGNYEISLKNLFYGLTIAETNGYEFERAQLLYRIGWVYWQIDQNQLAYDFSIKALELTRTHHYDVQEAYVLNLLGLLADKNHQFKEAYDYFIQALAIREKHGDKIGVASTLENLGDLFERQGDYSQSERYVLQSLAVAEKINSLEDMAYAYQGLGQLYTKMRKYNLADVYLSKSEAVLSKIKLPKILLDTYKNRRDLALALSKYKEANAFSILYDHLKDSVYRQNLNDRVFTLQYDFQLDQQSKEIEILNQQRDLQISENRFQRTILMITIIVLIIVCFVVYLVYSNYRKIRKFNLEISGQKEEIQVQSEELTESNHIISQQNEKLKEIHNEVVAQNEELIQSQEEIAAQRDITAEQNLKLEEARLIIEKQHQEIKLRNENLEREVENRTKELVEYNQQLEQFAFISSHNLRAPVARILGLGQLMELSGRTAEDEELIYNSLITTTRELDRVVKDLNTILEIKKNNTAVLSEIDLDDELKLIRINLEKEIIETGAEVHADFSDIKTIRSIRPYIDSILINLISNAIKYRHPKRKPVIHLKTARTGDFILLTVSDNGLGINLPLYKEKMFNLYSRFHDHVEGKGLGLYLVKAQVIAMGGKIEVESEVNKGLTFYIYLKA